MMVKSYTVSTSLVVTHQRNGQETGQTVYSEPGIRAELMLQSNDQYRSRDRPSTAHISLTIDIERPPNLNGAEMHDWLREQLQAMLEDPEQESS